MKEKKHLALLIALFGATQALSDEGTSMKPIMENRQKKWQLSLEQRSCLEVYKKWRARVIFTLKLSNKTINSESTPEEILRAGAPRINLPKDATWEDVLTLDWVKKICTEEKRKKYGTMFCSKEDASWVEILFSIESMRLRDDADKASKAQTTKGGRFLIW